METMVFHGFSMFFFHGFSMVLVFPWFFHGCFMFSMVFPWFFPHFSGNPWLFQRFFPPPSPGLRLGDRADAAEPGGSDGTFATVGVGGVAWMLEMGDFNVAPC